MAFGNGQDKVSAPVAAVVSTSKLMLKRICDPLERNGFEVVEVDGPGEFLRHPRQRPFVVCFMDVRGQGGNSATAECKRLRPSERYVFIRENWGSDRLGVVSGHFGGLCEGFSEGELLCWARKAAQDERASQEAPPLEELLHGLFTDFLRNLGPASIKDLHKLVTERVERPLFASVLEWSRGNQSKASEALGLHRNTLRARMKTLGVPCRHGRAEDE